MHSATINGYLVSFNASGWSKADLEAYAARQGATAGAQALASLVRSIVVSL